MLIGKEIDLLKNYPKSKRDLEKEVKKLTKIGKLLENLIEIFLMAIEDMVMVDIIIMKGFGQKQSLILKTIGT